jgi:hypothetical protein
MACQSHFTNEIVLISKVYVYSPAYLRKLSEQERQLRPCKYSTDGRNVVLIKMAEVDG